MHKRLKNAGFVTHSLTLPGHGTKPEDLVGVTAEDWIDAVVAKYREVRDMHPTLHLMGMCMGSLLAAALASRERHAKGRLVLLAAPIYIDGWATPWYGFLRPLLYRVPRLPQKMKIEEEDPFGIKNEQLRAIVKAKFERGENFHYRWVPLECLRQVDRLRAIVMKGAPKIACQTLVVHAREDELTSMRSAKAARPLPAWAPAILFTPGCTHATSGMPSVRNPAKSPASSRAASAATAAVRSAAVIFGSFARFAPGIGAPKNSSTFFATISRSLSTQIMW